MQNPIIFDDIFRVYGGQAGIALQLGITPKSFS
jgi:hypothetical protein